MIALIGLKTCDTCRKALKALQAAGQPAELRDLREVPPTAGELAEWQDFFGDKLLNTRSATWRGLTEIERQGDPAALMAAHPALVKRPVILRPGADPLLGWTAATQAALGL